MLKRFIGYTEISPTNVLPKAQFPKGILPLEHPHKYIKYVLNIKTSYVSWLSRLLQSRNLIP